MHLADLLSTRRRWRDASEFFVNDEILTQTMMRSAPVSRMLQSPRVNDTNITRIRMTAFEIDSVQTRMR